MLPAPLLALVRYLVVYGCARAAARGWTFFALTPEATEAVVDIVAAAVAGLGVYAATARRAVARLLARHHARLLDAAAAVPGVTRIEATPALAAETASPAVVAAQPGVAA